LPIAKPFESRMMLTISEVPLREDYRRDLENLQKIIPPSRSASQRRGAMQAGARLLLLGAIIFGLVTLVAAFFGEARSLWTERPMFPAALLAFFAYALWKGWHDGGQTHDVQLEAIREAGKVDETTTARLLSLNIDQDCFAIDHEHGRIFVTANGVGGSSFFDVSTIADDPRESMARSDELASHWQWLDIPGTGFLRDVFSDGDMQRLRAYSICTVDQWDRVLALLDCEDGLDPLNTLPIAPGTLEAQIRSALGR
jgi:hypothetical protein